MPRPLDEAQQPFPLTIDTMSSTNKPLVTMPLTTHVTPTTRVTGAIGGIGGIGGMESKRSVNIIKINIAT